jgi:transcriptional regulator with GAF, ATPase, and Fis domain
MQSQKAWATGFLSHILIRYLEKQPPSVREPIPYPRILSAAPGFETIRDPEAFLKDINHWIPYTVLSELLRYGEEATGRKDMAYQAALDFFSSANERIPSVLEMIVQLLNNMKWVLMSSNFWAGAYTNYLNLQCLEKPDTHNEVVILAQYDSGVAPLLGNHFLVQGNFEGFTRLYDFVKTSRCEVEFSQIRLRDLLSEFSGYRQEEVGGLVLLQEIGTGKTIAEAESIRLSSEHLQAPRGFHAAPTGQPLLPIEEGGVRVFTASTFGGISSPSGTIQARQSDGSALRILRGGTLKTGPLTFKLEPGQIYDAPYFRYRFYWEEEGLRTEPQMEQEKLQHLSALLFRHLKELKVTQRRLLSFMMDNTQLLSENLHLKEEVQQETGFGGLIGKSPAMRQLFALIKTLAVTDSTVLIQGDTGTGKELVARLIHYNSLRKEGRFVAINCGALSESLLESELFGHERGAFTGAVVQKKGKFEIAHGGTIFLDEIGEVSPAMQVKLLRVLQERELQRVGGNEAIPVDIRVIAATNQNLDQMMAEGRFRQDLYYRLCVVPIRIAPLRERTEDIPLLANHFLAKHQERLKKLVAGILPETLDRLLSYSWPGNVRELENAIERAILLTAHDGWITADLLPTALRAKPGSSMPLTSLDSAGWRVLTDSVKRAGSMDPVLRSIEHGLVKRMVQEHGGNKSRAAKALGRTYRWLRKLEKTSQTDTPTASDPST